MGELLMVWFGKCEPVGYLLTPESSFAGSVSLFFFLGLWSVAWGGCVEFSSSFSSLGA